MLKRFFWVFLLVGLLVACTEDDGPTIKPEPTPADDSVTILSYLIANNNLDDFMKFNVCIMYDGMAVMTEPATLLIYWDGQTAIGENKSKHLILKYETDGKGKINGKSALDYSMFDDDMDKYIKAVLDEGVILKEYPEQLSTDKDVMATVLQDMADFSPTQNFGLIVGSHGSSWYNTITTTRALGYDGSTSNSINLPDMVEAMESLEKPFKFILFDACYMSTMEVAYEFRQVADYQIASVMEVPAYGFPYDYFMGDLYKGTVEGYKQVCQSFVDYYKSVYDEGDIAWGTIALIDSKEVEGMTQSIRQQIVTHKDTLASYVPKRIQEYGRHAGHGIAYDLEHFVKDLNGGEMPMAFAEQLKKTVLYKGCLEDSRYYSFDYDVDAANYCGLGIYIPQSNKSTWNPYFKTLEWYEASGWSEVSFSWGF